MCKVLGRTTAQFRWFAILYLFVMFFIIPGVVMGKMDIIFDQYTTSLSDIIYIYINILNENMYHPFIVFWQAFL